MKIELKEKWLAALRSGEYQQCTSSLICRAYDGSAVAYCCLGVLAKVAGLNVISGEFTIKGEINDVDGVGNSPFYALRDEYNPIWELAAEHGSEEPPVKGMVLSEAIDMNDNDKSFIEIADYLETHLKAE
jgi:hypothetical protein